MENTFKGSKNYVASSELMNAVNIAMALKKPLLIKGEHRLSRARLALDEKRFFERHGDVHRVHQLRARNIVFAAFESIFHSVLLAKNQNQ